MTWIWISTNRVTVAVEIDEDGKLKTVPHYLHKYRGRPIREVVNGLARWHGGLRLADLDDPHRARED